MNHDKWYSKEKRKVLLLGLDKAGKTCLVEFLKSKHFFGDYAATTDVQIEDLKFEGLTWIVFDCAGGERQRVFWRHHYSGTQGVVFLVDVSESEARLKEAGKLLRACLEEVELSKAKFLVLLNKTDLLSEKVDEERIADKMGVSDLNDPSRISFKTASLKKNEGINEGLSWLAKNMVAI